MLSRVLHKILLSPVPLLSKPQWKKKHNGVVHYAKERENGLETHAAVNER